MTSNPQKGGRRDGRRRVGLGGRGSSFLSSGSYLCPVTSVEQWCCLTSNLVARTSALRCRTNDSCFSPEKGCLDTCHTRNGLKTNKEVEGGGKTKKLLSKLSPPSFSKGNPVWRSRGNMSICNPPDQSASEVAVMLNVRIADVL